MDARTAPIIYYAFLKRGDPEMKMHRFEEI